MIAQFFVHYPGWSWGMLAAIWLAALAVASTVVGAWDKLTGGVRGAVVLGSLLVAISFTTQVFQVGQKQDQLAEIASQQRRLDDAELLLKSDLVDIDEASGGATAGNVAYVVDDDESRIFTLKYVDADGEYRPWPVKGLRILDDRPRTPSTKMWGKKCNDSEKKPKIEDLEGAALYNGKLYLTTSQANSKDGESQCHRWLFLEVSPLDGRIRRATRTLRAAIQDFFKKGIPDLTDGPIAESMSDTGKLEVMQIEGLVIDREGQVYLGFRAPLVEGRALVLRTAIEDIFAGAPRFDTFLLDLRYDRMNYGIVSMEYDAAKDRLLILGNDSRRRFTLPPAMWSWKPGDPRRMQDLVRYRGDLFTVFDVVGSRPAKPEVILLPRTNRIQLLFDAEGTGGQLGLTRKGTELRRVGI